MRKGGPGGCGTTRVTPFVKKRRRAACARVSGPAGSAGKGSPASASASVGPLSPRSGARATVSLPS